MGYMIIEGRGGPINGIAKFALFRFHCTGVGISDLTIAEYYLMNIYQEPILVDYIHNGVVTQTTWYFKHGYIDYAPNGVPDFDQKQWLVPTKNWTNPWPPVGTWSYCGPVAVSDSLWWLDSQYEPNPMPPSTPNDGFPLVQTYLKGKDDHDPLNVPYLVEDLAWLMDTDGQRTGLPHCGTEVHDMEWGIDQYLQIKGLQWKFYEHTENSPSFWWIEEEIEKCEDVILLLGFWQQDQAGYWWRIGGHYVTCAGVDSYNMMLAVSDPYLDAAEIGLAPGIVLPPPPHGHPPVPPDTVHNDAEYVSHDFYGVGKSPSPGGLWGLPDYPAYDVIDNFGSCQNTPIEFEQLDHPYMPGLPIYTEIEYAVVTSCKTGIVAAGSEDANIYVWDFLGNLQWQYALANPVVSVAMDNDGRYIAAGTRSIGVPITGNLWLFDYQLGAPPGNVLWATTLPISTSYDGAWGGTESKSVDVKYNNYNGYVVVAAATDQGLYLYDQSGSLIWQYYDQYPETLVRISQDGNFIVCVDYNTGYVHYFSHLRDGTPGWGPKDGIPIWSRGQGDGWGWVHWAAISGNGEYVAISGWHEFPGDYVMLMDRMGNMIWYYSQNWDNLKPGWIRVDMPCSGRSVVSVNDDPSDFFGTDLNYWSDMADGLVGWSGLDRLPTWNYWPGKELGNPQNPIDDFYTVSISENGDFVATGGIPRNTYLLKNVGIIQQQMGLMPNRIQSVDLTFEGKYGASVDFSGTIWFFNKDTGVLWAAAPTGAPFHCVAISKIYPCMFPYPNHDLVVSSVTTCKDVGKPKPIVTQNNQADVYVEIQNNGDFTESFIVTVYANNTFIGMAIVSSQASHTTATYAFTWDTTGWTKGEYIINAYVTIAPDEINVYDNNRISGIVITMTRPGDVTAEGDVNVLDLIVVSTALDPPWNPTADVKHDHEINVLDLIIVSNNLE
jgi:hypothetical protein